MRRRHDPKIKLTVYVSRTVASQLDLVCKDRTKNKSKLTETALAQLLNPQHNAAEDASMPKRLDRLSREVSIIHRHQQIALESFGLFVRHYFAMSPPLPPSEHQSAQALSQQRFQRFIEQVGRRLAGTSNLVAEIAEHLGNNDVKSSASVSTPNTVQSTTPTTQLKS